jgi:hypothetical protein
MTASGAVDVAAGGPGVAIAKPNIERCETLIRRALRDFGLDLEGLSVLTEAASGPFVNTPLIAALAGARQVLALTRDSPYGPADEVAALTRDFAASWGVGDHVEILFSRDDARISEADVVTNLGFVRPLDRPFLERLGPSAAIALMFEPWEHREADVDLASCRELGVPVLGTNEDDPRLQTFEYLQGIAAKLLFDLGVEVFGSRLVLVSRGRFASQIEKGLTAMGARVSTFRPPVGRGDSRFESAIGGADAMIAADYPASGPLLGAGGYTSAELLERNAGLVLAHIAGDVDAAEIAASGMIHAPARIAGGGSMSVTAGFLGPKPVIDLHAAGLSVGAALVRARRRGHDAAEAESMVLAELPLARGFTESEPTP